MKKTLLSLVIALILAPLAIAQTKKPPTEAIDISKADIDAVLKNSPPKIDQSLRIVDMGKYNLAVGVVHRGPTKEKANDPIVGVYHDQTTETYVILSGTGTLVTGGTLENPKQTDPNSENVKLLNGPSTNATVKDGFRRQLHAGDVVIIPAGVFHGWTGITDQVTYLSVRPDIDHVLPSGYVNPAIKK